MTENEQIRKFSDEVGNLIAHYAREYDLSAAATIGALYLHIHRLSTWTISDPGKAQDEDENP